MHLRIASHVVSTQVRRVRTAGTAARLVAALCLSSPVIAQPTGLTVVAVRPAERREVAATLSLVGSVMPYTRSTIASEMAGLVEEMPVEEGDRLEAGAPICRLRNTTHRMAHEEANARLRQLQAQLDELEAGTRKEEIEQARALREEAKALMEKWDQELERITRLREERSASPKELHDTVAEHSAAKERLARAAAAYDLAVAGPRKEEILRARFAVEAQKAVVARLKYDLDQTTIRAPFTGYVTLEFTEVGQWVSAGGSVVELIELERVLVRIDVPESAISAVRVGTVIPVSIDALDNTFHGNVVHVIPQADVKARTFPIEIAIDNPEHELRSGMFARARVPAGPVVDSVIVPRDAILQRQGSDYVIAITPSPTGQGQMAVPTPVRLGAEVGAWVAIESTMIQPGTPVAVKGHDRIYGPQPVQTVSAPAPATRPAGGAPQPDTRPATASR